MINKIWAFFIIIGITYSLFFGNINNINLSIINSGKNSLNLLISIIPLMIIYTGIMNIAKDSGLLKKLTKIIRPLLNKIFPELRNEDETLEYLSSNIIINMLGIHNASTPFGLKAIKLMQEKNKNKKVATRSMITFLILNTSGVTLIATDIIAIRNKYGALNPTLLVLPTIIVTTINTVFALLIDRYFYWRDTHVKHK